MSAANNNSIKGKVATYLKPHSSGYLLDDSLSEGSLSPTVPVCLSGAASPPLRVSPAVLAGLSRPLKDSLSAEECSPIAGHVLSGKPTLEDSITISSDEEDVIEIPGDPESHSEDEDANAIPIPSKRSKPGTLKICKPQATAKPKPVQHSPAGVIASPVQSNSNQSSTKMDGPRKIPVFGKKKKAATKPSTSSTLVNADVAIANEPSSKIQPQLSESTASETLPQVSDDVEGPPSKPNVMVTAADMETVNCGAMPSPSVVRVKKILSAEEREKRKEERKIMKAIKKREKEQKQLEQERKKIERAVLKHEKEKARQQKKVQKQKEAEQRKARQKKNEHLQPANHEQEDDSTLQQIATEAVMMDTVANPTPAVEEVSVSFTPHIEVSANDQATEPPPANQTQESTSTHQDEKSTKQKQGKGKAKPNISTEISTQQVPQPASSPSSSNGGPSTMEATPPPTSNFGEPAAAEAGNDSNTNKNIETSIKVSVIKYQPPSKPKAKVEPNATSKALSTPLPKVAVKKTAPRSGAGTSSAAKQGASMSAKHPFTPTKRSLETETASDAAKCPKKKRKKLADLDAAFPLVSGSGPVWVQCDTANCQKWRKLDSCSEPSQVPESWVCSMNSDPEHNTCSAPEEDWADIDSSQEFVESEFVPGTIVWAKMDSYPWWPAMVEADPDFATYYQMLPTNSSKPAKYHVVYFDTPVCRGWVSSHHITLFTELEDANKASLVTVNPKYKKSLHVGVKAARAALKMPLEERLEKLAFIRRFRRLPKAKQLKDVSNDTTYLPPKKNAVPVIQWPVGSNSKSGKGVGRTDGATLPIEE